MRDYDLPKDAEDAECVEITLPLPLETYYLPVGTMKVRVVGKIATPANKHAYIGIYTEAEDAGSIQNPDDLTLPDPTLLRGTFITPGLTGDFDQEFDVPCIGKNFVRAWASKEKVSGSYAWCGQTSRVEINAVAIQLVTVRATQCLWYYGNNTAVPNDPAKWPTQEIPADHSPQVIALPGIENPSQANLHVVVTATTTWAHGDVASCSSGPGGRAGVAEAAHANYPNTYAATGKTINELAAGNNLGRLVGMFDTGGATFDELAIGQDGSGVYNQTVPVGSTKLILANHDSFEWNNNSGEMLVTIQWKRA